MTYRNQIKYKIQHAYGGLFDTLSIESKLTDAQMECMQFGICNSSNFLDKLSCSSTKIL